MEEAPERIEVTDVEGAPEAPALAAEAPVALADAPALTAEPRWAPRPIPLGTIKAAATLAACTLAIVGMCVGEARARSERIARAPLVMPSVAAAPPTAASGTAAPVPPLSPADAALARDFGMGSPASSPWSGGQKRGSTPQLRAVGLPTLTGRLPAEVVNRIVRQGFARFRLCYEAGLRTRSDLAGRVSVKFVIGRDGSVTQAAASSESTLPDQGVVGCIVRSFLSLSFPAPDNGIEAVVYRMALTVE